MRFGKKRETLFSDLQLFALFFILLKILLPIGIDMFQKQYRLRYDTLGLRSGEFYCISTIVSKPWRYS